MKMRWKIKNPEIVINRLQVEEPGVELEDDNEDIEKQELDLVCKSRRECAEILGVGDGNERQDIIGKSATAQICGLYISDLTSQLNPEDGNDIAIMFQAGSLINDMLENHVLLLDSQKCYALYQEYF